jgi:hypothetical protein
VIDTIAKYYNFAISGFSNLMYLNCDGWNEQEEQNQKDIDKSNVQTDCRTYFDDGILTFANRYSIPGSTNVNLFDAEMKYLYENSFTVLTMADLAYNESTNQLYIKPLD